VDQDLEERIARAWESVGDLSDDGAAEAEFRAGIDKLVAELSEGSPIASFERACAWDSTGHSDRAVPLYLEALKGGLHGLRRRRAVIQLASSLRNVGHPEQSVELLTAERDLPESEVDAEARQLGDAISATLALALTDLGREREAVSIAVGALAPHLVRYQRSMANYARLLMEP
jgi:Tetratrico peptide repeat